MMKSTPFNPKIDLEPVPFSSDLCEAARSLKEVGLKWTPHVGCFVWDPQAIIKAPSSFPGRIYFILNMNHFLKRFETVEKMKEKLVWIPTWYQAMKLAEHLDVLPLKMSEMHTSARDGKNALIQLYKHIAARLQ